MCFRGRSSWNTRLEIEVDYSTRTRAIRQRPCRKTSACELRRAPSKNGEGKENEVVVCFVSHHFLRPKSRARRWRMEHLSGWGAHIFNIFTQSKVHQRWRLSYRVAGYSRGLEAATRAGGHKAVVVIRVRKNEVTGPQKCKVMFDSQERAVARQDRQIDLIYVLVC